jgi:2-hydroxychromene-2-carboxylate isomerase
LRTQAPVVDEEHAVAAETASDTVDRDIAAVDFWFDPACPWTWITSRWLVVAAEERDFAVTWRPYSLKFKNGDGVPEQYRESVEESHRALRVIARLAAEAGNDAVDAFYTERGHRFFGGDGTFPDLAEVLEAAGLDPAFAASADDPAYDAAIQASMDHAHALAGDSNGSPILAVRGTGRGFFGPVLTAVPDTKASAQLWDALETLFTIPEVHELKRDRAVPPTFPARAA